MSQNTDETPNVWDDSDKVKAAFDGVWRAGYETGRDAGYKMGYSNGKSTLGRGWFFFTALAFMISGMLMGMILNFTVSCGPDISCQKIPTEITEFLEEAQ